MELIKIDESHRRIKGQVHVGSDKDYIKLLKDANKELGELARKLRAENQNLIAALGVSTAYSDELNAKIKAARGHMNLYRLFSCEGSDSYDPECAEKNLDKVQEVLK